MTHFVVFFFFLCSNYNGETEEKTRNRERTSVHSVSGQLHCFCGFGVGYHQIAGCRKSRAKELPGAPCAASSRQRWPGSFTVANVVVASCLSSLNICGLLELGDYLRGKYETKYFLMKYRTAVPTVAELAKALRSKLHSE